MACIVSPLRRFGWVLLVFLFSVVSNQLNSSCRQSRLSSWRRCAATYHHYLPHLRRSPRSRPVSVRASSRAGFVA